MYIQFCQHYWRRKWQPTPVLFPGKPHGWRSLVGYSPWGRKESDTTERLHFTSFIEETILSPLCGIDTFIKHLVTMNMWVYFWAFYSISLVYMSGFMSAPYCFDYYWLVMWTSFVAQLVKNHLQQETWVQFLNWEDPLVKGKSTHSSILAWEITVHGVTKSQTWLSKWLEYCSTFKKKEILPFVTIWRNLEHTILSQLDTERQMLFWNQRLSKASKSNEVITSPMLG